MSSLYLQLSKRWLVIGLIGVSISSCRIARGSPTPPVEVTRLVPITQIVMPQIIEVTRVVPATPLEVTRLVQVTPEAPQATVEVTRIVMVTQVVVVTQVVTVAPVIPTPTVVPPRIDSPTASPVATLTNPDLLLWYDFEGNILSSGRVMDRSGNGFDTRLVGSAGTASGKFGSQSIVFNGDGYLQAQSNPAAGRSAVTFSLWFKTDHPEWNQKFASAAWWSGGPASGWVLATHLPEFWSEDRASLYFPDPTSNDNNFRVNEWVHEVVTYDGSRIREYTDGVLVNDWPTTGAPLGLGQAMVVGGWPSSGFYYQGSMDEFQIFAWSLSQQEVQMLYEQGR